MMMMMRLKAAAFVLTAFAALLIVVTTPASSAKMIELQQEEQGETDDIDDVHTRNLITTSSASTIQRLPSLTLLKEAVDRAPDSVVSKLDGSAGGGGMLYTTFMPINSAFTALDQTILTKLFEFGDNEWNMHRANLLEYHITAGKVTEDDLSYNLSSLRMENDEMVLVSNRNRNDGAITRLYSPSNPNVMATSRIVGAEENGSGMAFLVDAVLLPAWATRTTMDYMTGSQLTSTFASLLIQADLDDRSSSLMNDMMANDEAGGGLTVFAPSNQAFERMDSATYDYLTSTEGQDTLVDVLLYHIVPQKVHTSMNMRQGVNRLRTAQGDLLEVTKDDIFLMIHGHNFVQSPDQLTLNGVVHVVDQVLLPALPQIAQIHGGVEDSRPHNNNNSGGPDEKLEILSPQKNVWTQESGDVVFAKPAQVVAGGSMLLQTIATTDDYSTLFDVWTGAKIDESLKSDPAQYTLFAPRNSAFEIFPIVQQYLLNTDGWMLHLRDIVNFHLTEQTASTLSIATATNGGPLTMRNGETVQLVVVVVDDTTAGANVVPTRSVQLRPAVMGSATVNSPTAPIQTAGGGHQIYSISQMLLPRFFGRNVLDVIAAGAPKMFSLIRTAGLEDYIQTTPDLMAFAPTDEGFDVVDDATMTRWQSPEGKAELEALLKYHFSHTLLPLESIPSGMTRIDPVLQQGNNQQLLVTKYWGGVLVDTRSLVTDPDHIAKNGIVHFVDYYLDPN